MLTTEKPPSLLQTASRAMFGAAMALGLWLGAATPGSADEPAPAPQHEAQEKKGHAQALPLRAPSGKSFVQFELGQRNVKAVLASQEAVWVGSSGGVIKYEPATGTQTVYDNRNALLSNGVFYLGRFGDDLWVGTYGGGLSILNVPLGTWRNYNIPDGMADAFVYDALKTKNGDIWIATWSGANRIIGGNLDKIENWELFTVENTKGGLPNDWVYGLAEGRNGEVWIGTEGGVARFREGQWTRWTHESGLGADYEQVKADIEFQSDPGEVSAHHARQKAEQGLGGVTVAYNPNYVVSLAVTQDGVVWAGTWGAGLSRFDGERWTTFTVRDGLPSNHVFALEQDAAGALWIGTSRGLAKREGDGFKTFGVHDGLVSDVVFSIGFGAGPDLWIGSYGGLTWFPHGPVRVAK